jgi:hypothetical protein
VVERRRQFDVRRPVLEQLRAEIGRDDARRLLFEAVTTGAPGIVLYDEALLAALTDKERRILDACHRPICFPVPMAERRRAGEREAEYLASVLRAAIGYQLRIPR